MIIAIIPQFKSMKLANGSFVKTAEVIADVTIKSDKATYPAVLDGQNLTNIYALEPRLVVKVERLELRSSRQGLKDTDVYYHNYMVAAAPLGAPDPV